MVYRDGLKREELDFSPEDAIPILDFAVSYFVDKGDAVLRPGFLSDYCNGCEFDNRVCTALEDRMRLWREAAYERLLENRRRTANNNIK